MSKGPGLFSDIGKKAKDLLTKDYSYDQKFTVSTCTDAGVGLTSTAVKKGLLSTGDIAAQFKYKRTIIDLKVDTESNISATITALDILPSTKTIATLKFPEYSSGKLEIQYFHHHATLTSTVALNQSPKVDLSGTIGNHGLAFGAETTFDTASGNFTKYNAGFSMTKPDLTASIILADKGDVLKASYVHSLDKFNRSAAVAEITRKFSTNENTFTVGSSYVLDPHTTVKTKLDNHGKVGALLQHQLQPKSILTISSEFDTKALEKNPKFGLALSLKP